MLKQRHQTSHADATETLHGFANREGIGLVAAASTVDPKW